MYFITLSQHYSMILWGLNIYFTNNNRTQLVFHIQLCIRSTNIIRFQPFLAIFSQLSGLEGYSCLEYSVDIHSDWIFWLDILIGYSRYPDWIFWLDILIGYSDWIFWLDILIGTDWISDWIFHWIFWLDIPFWFFSHWLSQDWSDIHVSSMNTWFNKM